MILKRSVSATRGDICRERAFHTSLLACCLESVFASYSTPGMAFPAILHQLAHDRRRLGLEHLALEPRTRVPELHAEAARRRTE